jgi:hypothetical protein
MKPVLWMQCFFAPWIQDPDPGSYFRELCKKILGKKYLHFLTIQYTDTVQNIEYYGPVDADEKYKTM